MVEGLVLIWSMGWWLVIVGLVEDLPVGRWLVVGGRWLAGD